MSGASCFSDPALRDIIFATPPRFDETELLNGGSLAVPNGKSLDLVNISTSDDNFMCSNVLLEFLSEQALIFISTALMSLGITNLLLC